MITEQAAQLAEWAAQALVVAEQLRIKTKPIGSFPLDEDQRGALTTLAIRPGLKKKLLTGGTDFTVAEVAGLVMSVAEALPEAETRRQIELLMASRSLIECLEVRIDNKQGEQLAGNSMAKSTSSAIFQFKITLIESEPAIWRRIQVEDCTLDKLHEHIQTAMGWENSHLHQFEIGGERFGDPELLDDGFVDFECIDSTETMISKVVPETGKRFRLFYEYDFGDGWKHEVLFEGCPPKEKRQKYPVCLEGERACPPEDVGGVWGYAGFLNAIADPDHLEHDDYAEWAGDFDAEKFSVKDATRAMRRGLPDWREM